MAALDFPSSPTNGQYYNGYVYNAANDTWDSAYAPRAATIPITGGNPVINGAFDIWQRGTSFNGFSAGTNVFGPDRFYAYRAGLATGLTVSRQPAGLTGFQYCARVQRDSGNTSTNNGQLLHDIETSNSIGFAGKQVTLSFYARAGANYSGSALVSSLLYGTGTDQALRNGYTGQTPVIDQSNTLTTTWTRYVHTATVPVGATQLGLYFNTGFTGTAGAADYFEVTGVQLEQGAAATDFRRNAPSIAGELAACQRYYQQTYPFGYGAGTVTSAGALMQYVPAVGNSIRLPIQLGTRMRTAPVVYTYGPNTGAATKWQYEGAGATSQFEAGITFGSESGFLIYATGATVAGSNVYIHYTASAEL